MLFFRMKTFKVCSRQKFLNKLFKHFSDLMQQQTLNPKFIHIAFHCMGNRLREAVEKENLYLFKFRFNCKCSSVIEVGC